MAAPPRPARVARLYAGPLPELDLTIAPWPGELVSSDVCGQMFVRRTPPNPPVAEGSSHRPPVEPALFVHGLGGASTNWTDLSALTAGWLDAEALDLPGFGNSSPPLNGSYALETHVRAVLERLVRHDRGPVHLIGNSMGGAVAVVVAARRPDLVRTLTLMSPAMPDLRVQRATQSAMPIFLMPGLTGTIERYAAKIPPEQRAQGTLELCFADPSRVPPHRLAEAVDEVRARGEQPWAMSALIKSLRGLVRSYLVPRSKSLWTLAASIQAPTLVIWGAADRLVDVALAPRLATSMPDARLLVLPGVGHVAQLEDPISAARAVIGLIEANRMSTET